VYSLTLSDAEVVRYRTMAAKARVDEAEQWQAAGIVPGARVVDVGCGPAAALAEMADIVGPTGSVVGVDANPGTVATARALLDGAGFPDAEVRVGTGDATGLEPGSFDVAVMRHVLAHNGPREQAMVDHLATLVRPGGCVYLVDIDGPPATTALDDADIADLDRRYGEFHLAQGNDLRVGTRLGALLDGAGLDVVRDERTTSSLTVPVGVRPPSLAAADAMVGSGIATPADVERWQAAFARIDARDVRPTVTIVLHMAIGRR
jgi:SAM-dependent methyltransferase